MTATSTDEAASRLEPFRIELTGYCYRMLGSGFEAEDAVQETLLRAWRSYDRYDAGRASLRTWLYRIATNVCLDLLRGARRRALPVDLGAPAFAGPGLGEPASERVFVQPVPESLVLPTAVDPAEQAIRRETIRLAFVAALQHLPPRQRAVLILRDVLCWSTEEVADLLDTSVPAVTSVLQRARSTLRAVDVPAGEPWRPSDPAQRDLLARYCAAFERHDVAALVALLHEDATMSMPPMRWWIRGRDRIRAALSAPDAPCAGARLVPVAANGTPAFWQTRPGPDGVHLPFGLVVLDLHDGLVTGITTHLDVDRLVALFTPVVLDGSAART
ncbi:sigma-70 family RNA polymerase sigma factor [Micromonospora endolithica]|uniref:Sigma-70 family RNA polymerase sigma factor n=1 Tax=Micromonospora endolithica TaxID=230091 RepID=A0A3A9YXB0_9ACTN|nr:sigma-70 family RNA polymerase sigma factor [Micromonospora endolithica]RKN40668.1 sigma-70 family RNA polymerase sigma factor [Micromonospora endolithica]TWJ21758.1 RNA polymerase, sigma subunit, ECF family [Micromonospora endolithica]